MSTYDLTTIYPDGPPTGFPVADFAPVPGQALVMREQALKDRIDAIQARMAEEPQVEIPVKHTFAGGVYAREIFIPKGTVVIGKVHLTEHLNIMPQGDLTFLTVDGPKRLVAPATFASPPGTKKVAYANEDSIWINVHPALSTDPEILIDGITVGTYAEFDQLLNQSSYERVLRQYQLTPEYVRQVSDDESTFDPTPLPGVELQASSIEGLGLFASQPFAAGAVIAPVRANGKRTLAGRYSNHAHVPNCGMAWVNGEIVLVALQDVAEGDELTTDYAATLALLLRDDA